MADIDTSIYKNVGPQNGFGSLNPLQMLGVADAANKLSLFPLIQKQVEAQSKDAQLSLGIKGLNFAREGVAALAGNPNLTKRDVVDYLTSLSRQPGMESVPTDQFIDEVNNLPNDRKSLTNWVANHQAAAIGAAGAAGERTIGVTDAGQPIQGTVAQGLRRAQGLDQPAPIAPPAAGAPSAAPPPPAQQGIVSTLPPGSQKSIDTMQDQLIRAGNYGQEIAPWNQALSAINDLKAKYGKGYFAPGSKGRQDFQSYFYGVSPTLARWMGVDEDKLKNYAEADKYLTQAVQARASSFGAHTDQQLATTISGSPNVHVNDLAVDDVVKMSIALRRMEQAQTLQNAKLGGPQYTANSAKWATTQDPRAYAIDLLDPDQVEKLKKSMPAGSAQRAKFNASLREAIQAGVITPPQRSQSQATPSANGQVAGQ